MLCQRLGIFILDDFSNLSLISMNKIVLSDGNSSPSIFMAYGSKTYLVDFQLSITKSPTGKNGSIKIEVPKINDIGIKNIDVVLLSNFDSYTALPYLVQSSDFRARIYATVPTIDLGR